MFESLGRLVIRRRLLVVAVWLAAAALALALAPSLSDVGAADETSFLPADAPSVVARAALARTFPNESAAASATIVVSRPGGLTDSDRAWLGEVAGWLVSPTAPEAIGRVVAGVEGAELQPELAPLFRSTDGQVELLQVRLTVAGFQASANEAVDAIRAHLDATRPAGLETHVSGTAGVGRDYLAAIVEGTDRTTVVTIVLVVAILLLIYRAPIAALIPLLTIGAAFVTSRGLLGLLAGAGWRLPSLLESYLVVLVFGVGTDYTIFLISRFREELGQNEPERAGVRALGRIGAVITASAATVVVGLGSMAVGRFGLINTIGPGLALSIVVTLLASLTLTPALLAIAGRRLSWPFRPTVPAPAEPGAQPETGAWATLARWITTRPGLVAAVVLIVLALPLAGLTGLRTSFDVLDELPPTADARVGFDVVAAHFDRGQLLPVTVLVETPGTDLASPAGLALLSRATAQIRALDGVRSVRSLVDPDASGAPPTAVPSPDRLAAIVRTYLSTSRDASRLYVVTADDPYAAGAFATVRRIREALAGLQPPAGAALNVHVGGPSAEFADVETTINADFQRVGLITILGILVVLAVLLRSLVAPVYLVLSVILSYGTTLGLTALLLERLLGQPGLNYFIPLIVFVLLVALGSDYNIFLMSRVREESAGRELRAGIRVAAARTGTVITSAGIILAGTFAALTTGQFQVLFQVGAAVAIGVLIDTFLVRSLLIPSLTALLGEATWWPVGRPDGGLEVSARGEPPRR
ncbi:MAG: MMPL family transporter [Chloroflexota bacterium]